MMSKFQNKSNALHYYWLLHLPSQSLSLSLFHSVLTSLTLPLSFCPGAPRPRGTSCDSHLSLSLSFAHCLSASLALSVLFSYFPLSPLSPLALFWSRDNPCITWRRRERAFLKYIAGITITHTHTHTCQNLCQPNTNSCCWTVTRTSD